MEEKQLMVGIFNVKTQNNHVKEKRNISSSRQKINILVLERSLKIKSYLPELVQVGVGFVSRIACAGCGQAKRWDYILDLGQLG